MLRTSFRRSAIAAKSVARTSAVPKATATRFLSSLQRPFAVSSSSAAPQRVLPIYMRSNKLNVSVRTYADIVKVPEMAESISEGTLKEFSKQVGDFVNQDEEIASIETDKIDVAVNAPISGTIVEFLAQPDDTVEVGQDLLKIEPGSAPAEGSKPAQETKSEPEQPKPEEPKPEQPKPEQPKPDQSKPKETKSEEPKPAPKPAPKKEAPKPTFEAAKPAFSRSETPVKMNRMRLRIAERLKESQNTSASLTTFNEVDMSALLEMRKLYKDEIIKKKGIKFGFMGLFSKAAALAMKEWPAVNASIVGQDIVYRDFVDISVAVATPKGLVTPVVRNAESLDVLGIEQEIVNLSTKARDGQLTLEDMSGGTFTISNGGVFGSLYGTPIINMPQCAVLGLHGVKDRAVVINGKIEARPMMYLALTYDHRVVDGREAVSFLRTIKEYIEDPRKMLL